MNDIGMFKSFTTVAYVTDSPQETREFLRREIPKDLIHIDAHHGPLYIFQLINHWEVRILPVNIHEQDKFRDFVLHGQEYDELIIAPKVQHQLNRRTLQELYERIKPAHTHKPPREGRNIPDNREEARYKQLDEINRKLDSLMGMQTPFTIVCSHCNKPFVPPFKMLTDDLYFACQHCHEVVHARLGKGEEESEK